MQTFQRLLPLAAVFLVVFASCYPNGPETVQEFDSVVTAVDPEARFDRLLTYVLADTVVSITDPEAGGGEHNRAYDDDILAQVRANMDARGFQEEVPPASGDPTSDIVILVGVAHGGTHLPFG